MYKVMFSLLLQGTKQVFWYTGGNIVYIITPSSVYNIVGGVYQYFYPPKTDSEKLIEELREINKNLIELREAGVVIVDSNCETKDVIIDNIKLPEIVTTIRYEGGEDEDIPVAVMCEDNRSEGAVQSLRARSEGAVQSLRARSEGAVAL